MVDDIELLTAQQVADILGVHTETLLRWRQNKKGPPYIQIAPRVIRYAKDDLVAWIRSKSQND